MVRPYVIAVTGGAGAGKTTTARFFAERGAVVLDADVFGHVVLGDPAVVEQLVAEFGLGVLGDAGVVDRPALAAAAFTSSETVARLDAITHPPIAEALLAALDALGAANEPVEYAVIDVPLLAAVPSVLDRCDSVVAVEAPEAERISRLAARGIDEVDARRRIALQPSDEERRALATDVVVNDGAPADLEPHLERVWGRIAARAAIR